MGPQFFDRNSLPNNKMVYTVLAITLAFSALSQSVPLPQGPQVGQSLIRQLPPRKNHIGVQVTGPQEGLVTGIIGNLARKYPNMDFTKYINTAYLDNIDWSKPNPKVDYTKAVPDITNLDWLENFSEKSDSPGLSGVLSGKNPYYIPALENNVDWAAAFQGLDKVLGPDLYELFDSFTNTK